jgi:hypothetical protein
MISVATTPTQRDPITFTDKELESGIVIRLFLDYIYTGQIKGIGHQDETNTILVLIEFAKKWECPTNRAENQVEYWQSRIWPIRAFLDGRNRQ